MSTITKSRPTRTPSQHPAPRSRRTGRIALGVAGLATAGAALTILVVGVTGGTGTEAPPSPGVPSGMSESTYGSDRHLYNLAERLELEQRRSAGLSDGHLENRAP